MSNSFLYAIENMNNYYNWPSEGLANLREILTYENASFPDPGLIDPIDLVYIAMWEEELMPFFDINIYNIASKLSDYGKRVLDGLREWKEMKERRENGEISTHDYIEWKLNFSFVD